jgi:hypothetical protein
VSPRPSQKMHWASEVFFVDTSKEEAAEFERRLENDQQDLLARARLLGYYGCHRARSKVDVQNRIKHILWVFEYAPECDLGRTPCLYFPERGNLLACKRKRELLVRQCEFFKDNVRVLSDLAEAFSLDDSELALKHLRRAYKIARKKQKHQVAFWLSLRLYSVGLVKNDLPKLIEAVVFMQEVVDARKSDSDSDFRFRLAEMALDSKQTDLAIEVSHQMLEDLRQDDQNLHVAHIVLGRIACQNKDIQSAKEHLLLAAQVEGSSRLCSYGPQMKLAQDLLQAGEKEAVLQYLKDCKKFWDMGKRKLPNWIKAIEENRIPIMRGDD